MYYFFHVMLALQQKGNKRPLILVGTFQSLDYIVKQLRGVLMYVEEEPTQKTQDGVTVIIGEGKIEISCDMPITNEMGAEFTFDNVSMDVNYCLLGKDDSLGECLITPISVPTSTARLYFSQLPVGKFNTNRLLDMKLSALNLGCNTEAGYFREPDKIKKVLIQMEQHFPTLGHLYEQGLTQAQFRALILVKTCVSMETAIYVIDAIMDNGYCFHSSCK